MLVPQDSRQPLPPHGAMHLLPANAFHEEPQEASGVHIDADLGIGRDLVGALDHVAVAVQHVALDVAAPVAHGFAARELSAGLDVHAHALRFDQGRVDGDRNRRGSYMGVPGSPNCMDRPSRYFRTATMKSFMGPWVLPSSSRYLGVSMALSPTSSPTMVIGQPA